MPPAADLPAPHLAAFAVRLRDFCSDLAPKGCLEEARSSEQSLKLGLSCPKVLSVTQQFTRRLSSVTHEHSAANFCHSESRITDTDLS